MPESRNLIFLTCFNSLRSRRCFLAYAVDQCLSFSHYTHLWHLWHLWCDGFHLERCSVFLPGCGGSRVLIHEVPEETPLGAHLTLDNLLWPFLNEENHRKPLKCLEKMPHDKSFHSFCLLLFWSLSPLRKIHSKVAGSQSSKSLRLGNLAPDSIVFH